MELTKIKLDISFKKDVGICVLWGSVILVLMSLFFMIIGNFIGDEVLSDSVKLLGLIKIICLVCLSIITGHLFNKHIVYMYITKKDNLIYTYPYSKKEHILSNLYLIILEVITISIIVFGIVSIVIYFSGTIIFQEIDFDNVSFRDMFISTVFGILSIISTCGILTYLSYRCKSMIVNYVASLLIATIITSSISGFVINIPFEITKILCFSIISSIMLIITIKSKI